MNYVNIVTNGLLKQNPVFVMLLGICPAMATTTLAATALGMGLSTTFVLICSNILIAMIKGMIPKQVRLPCFVIVIAGFTTIVIFMLRAYMPNLYEQLGLYLSLIVVNCIILGRAEVFARKNGVLPSALDGIGMGLGFTLALLIMGCLREIFGLGLIFGINIPFFTQPIPFFTTPAGGFFVFAVVITVVNAILRHLEKKPKQKFGCEGCRPVSSGKAIKGGCSS